MLDTVKPHHPRLGTLSVMLIHKSGTTQHSPLQKDLTYSSYLQETTGKGAAGARTPLGKGHCSTYTFEHLSLPCWKIHASKTHVTADPLVGLVRPREWVYIPPSPRLSPLSFIDSIAHIFSLFSPLSCIHQAWVPPNFSPWTTGTTHRRPTSPPSATNLHSAASLVSFAFQS
jgi:hypothetical protein